MEVYLVGGAVRDQLLDLPVEERDWLVVGATPQQMLDKGFNQVTGGFPVFLHPETGDEYALARRETKTGHGYRGFSVETGADVTLEEDLSRRDLTINAMALDSRQHLIDPCNGQEDLEQGLLRHVTEAFQEDPVRVLRVARFAAKLGRWGFRVAHGTHGLMKKMARSEEFLSLKKDRFWKEMIKALGYDQPWRFFQVLYLCGALEKLLPQMARAMEDESGHGAADSALPRVLQRTVELGAGVEVRLLASLLHAIDSEQDIKELEEYLPLERRLRRLLHSALGIKHEYPGLLEAPAELLYQYRQVCFKENEETRGNLSQLARVLYPSIWEATEKHLAKVEVAVESVNPRSLMEKGLTGAALGKALDEARVEAIDQSLKLGGTGI